jgi:hypothetical protein
VHDSTPSFGTAVEAVEAVISWYNAQIHAEHTAPVPDAARIERLKRERQPCVADHRALQDAGPEDVSGEDIARITADYAARLKRLEGTA